MTHKNSIFNGNLYVLFLVLSFFAVPILVPVGTNEHYQTMMYLTLSHLTAMALYFIVTKPTLKQLAEEFNIRPISLSIGLLSFAMGIIMQPVMMIISGLSSYVFPNNMSKAILDYSQMPFHLLFVTIAVIPAVMEEIGFRGIVLSNYKNMSVKKAALVTGLLFALIHLDLQQFLYTFIIGIIFAYMVKATGSILPTIIAHMAVNGTQIFMSYVQLPASMLPKPIEMFGTFLWQFFLTRFSILFSIVCTVYLILYFKQRSTALQNQENAKKQEIYNFEKSEADFQFGTVSGESNWEQSNTILEWMQREDKPKQGIASGEKIFSWPLLTVLFIYVVTVISTNVLQ